MKPEPEEEVAVILIGPWLLKKYSKGTVWIERAADGEGGEFGEVKLGDWIGEFYEKHF
jgi:hypothetical protein